MKNKEDAAKEYRIKNREKIRAQAAARHKKNYKPKNRKGFLGKEKDSFTRFLVNNGIVID